MSQSRKPTLSDRRALLRARPSDPVRPVPPAASVPPVDRRNPYLLGAVIGVLGGLLGAYVFRRAGDEAAKSGQAAKPIDNAQIFGLVLAVVSILRQIAEMARPPQKR